MQRLEIEVFHYPDNLRRFTHMPLQPGPEFEERELEHGLLIHDECPVRVKVIGRGEIAPLLYCHTEKINEIRRYRQHVQLYPVSVKFAAPSHFRIGYQPVACKGDILDMRILPEFLLEAVSHAADPGATAEFDCQVPFEPHVLVLHERSLHLDVQCHRYQHERGYELESHKDTSEHPPFRREGE